MGSPWQPLSPKDLHRPILATSSSFNTAARSSASSAASPTADRRRVGSGSSASGQGPADDRPVSGEGGSGGGAKKSPSIPLAPLDKGKGKAVVDPTLPATKARERKVPLGRVLEDVLKSANGRDKVFVSGVPSVLVCCRREMSSGERGPGVWLLFLCVRTGHLGAEVA